MEVKKNSIIQIVDVGHAWYGCILIVDEIKPWGVVAYIPVPHSNTINDVGKAFNRIENGKFITVGTADIIGIGG